MTDRPILFSGPMISALLDGRKTQTRRVLKPQPHIQPELHEPLDGTPFWCCFNGDEIGYRVQVPFAPGDRLWVRETWAKVGDEDDDIHACPDLRIPAYYRADMVDPERQHWRPSIFMPRWASRLTLTVTDVRVQRLQDIREDDAAAEGVEKQFYEGDDPAYRGDFGWRDYRDHPHSVAPWRSPIKSFQSLWDSLNAKRGFGWDANPWVVAVSFEVQEINIDQLEAA